MHSKNAPRNRLAKTLPEEWRKFLIENGVPRRKYAAVLRATLTDGRVIEELAVEEGWIVGLTRSALVGNTEIRIDFDPRTITDLQIIQVI